MKIILQYIKDLNVRPQIPKVLKKEVEVLVLAIICGYNSTSTGNKTKNKQVVLHQTKKFLHSKGNTQMKRQPVCMGQTEG